MAANTNCRANAGREPQRTTPSSDLIVKLPEGGPGFNPSSVSIQAYANLPKIDEVNDDKWAGCFIGKTLIVMATTSNSHSKAKVSATNNRGLDMGFTLWCDDELRAGGIHESEILYG